MVRHVHRGWKIFFCALFAFGVIGGICCGYSLRAGDQMSPHDASRLVLGLAFVVVSGLWFLMISSRIIDALIAKQFPHTL